MSSRKYFETNGSGIIHFIVSWLDYQYQTFFLPSLLTCYQQHLYQKDIMCWQLEMFLLVTYKVLSLGCVALCPYFTIVPWPRITLYNSSTTGPIKGSRSWRSGCMLYHGQWVWYLLFLDLYLKRTDQLDSCVRK
jgi:hypothetical protein